MSKNKVNTSPYEIEEQVALVEYLELQGIKFTAIPNGTFTGSWSAKKKAKKEGVQSGFPDLMIFEKSPKHDILFLEMKRQEGGRLSPQQREWISFLDDYGQCVAVAEGAEHAITILDKYRKGEY